MKKSIIIDIIASLYAILFLYTGLIKLIGQKEFRIALEKSPVVNHYIKLIGIGIPIIEVLIGLSLLFPFFIYWPNCRKWGLYGGTILMAIFTGYIAYMLKYTPSLPCSCGGIIQKMNWHQHLYFNTLFTILGILAILLNNASLKILQKDISIS